MAQSRSKKEQMGEKIRPLISEKQRTFIDKVVESASNNPFSLDNRSANEHIYDLASSPGAFSMEPGGDISNAKKPSGKAVLKEASAPRSGYANVNSQLDKLEEFNRSVGAINRMSFGGSFATRARIEGQERQANIRDRNKPENERETYEAIVNRVVREVIRPGSYTTKPGGPIENSRDEQERSGNVNQNKLLRELEESNRPKKKK